MLEAAGHAVTRADLPGLDILDPAQCVEQVAGHDVVVNSAAYTAVDAAETDEARAFAVNAVGAANLARAAHGAGAAMVQLSTDYVVAGDGREPYAADAPVAPATAYGRTKAAGEWAVRAECPRSWVVRTAWLYGARGKNFPATMQRLAGERDRLTVVADQVGQPTWTVDLAEGLVRIVDGGAPFGTWHATGAGECSWFDLARAVFEELGLDPERVTPISTDDFPLPGAAAAVQRAVARHVGRRRLEPLPHWRDALHRAAPSVLGGADAWGVTVMRSAWRMAVYEPDEGYLRQQVDSMQAQVGVSWTAHVVDDGSSDRSFEHTTGRLLRGRRPLRAPPSPVNLGSGGAFGEALRREADESVDAVALRRRRTTCGRLERLAATAAALGPGVAAVHSDLRLIDGEGAVIADSVWRRERRWTTIDLRRTVFRNSVHRVRADRAPRRARPRASRFPTSTSPRPGTTTTRGSPCAPFASATERATASGRWTTTARHGSNEVGAAHDRARRRAAASPARLASSLHRLRRGKRAPARGLPGPGTAPAASPARAPTCARVGRRSS